MSNASPIPLNPFQRVLARVYGDGAFAHVASLEEARGVGDGLFTFLMVELSDREDCQTPDDATRRLVDAIEDIRKVLHILEAIQADPSQIRRHFPEMSAHEQLALQADWECRAKDA